jgi:serine/threonine protein kinase
VEPIGKGGIGEVWKCVSPDNTTAAIKIIKLSHDEDDFQTSPTEPERAAMARINALCHPLLVSVDRVEAVNGELFVVTELADGSLWDEFEHRQLQGKPGISEDRIIAYMLDAAEVLDALTFQHGLQHLDVKPTNLLLINGHVKLADFGLLSSSVSFGTLDWNPFWSRGCSLSYASPEVLGGEISLFSDQYSLAVVYQKLATGNLPFAGDGFHDALTKRLNWAPNLEGLPKSEWPIVARALSPSPALRFPSCLEFVLALSESRTHSRKRLASGMDDRDCCITTQGHELVANGSVARPENAGNRQAMTAASVATRPDVAVSLPDEVGATQHVSTPLAGFDFLELLRKTKLSETWEARDAAGQMYCVQFLLGLPANDTPQSQHALSRLRSLSHPSLVEPRFVRDRFGRLAAVALKPQLTLKQRLADCRRIMLPGIPREELLGYLSATAKALDELTDRYDLRHLGLNSANLVLNDDCIQIAEFGQIPLLWLSQNLAAGVLNPAYAAPETDRAGESPTSDQFSLAVIYVEMLTGRQPNRTRSKKEFDAFLAPLQTADKHVVEKACHSDPAKRFASCSEMVQAFYKRTPQRDCLSTVSVAGRLPIVQIAELEQGKNKSSGALPSVEQFAADLFSRHTSRGPGPVSSKSPRTAQSSDPIVSESFPVQEIPPSLLKHKFQVVLEQCCGQTIERTDRAIRFSVQGKAESRSFFRKTPQSLNVNVVVEAPDSETAVFTSVSVRIETVNANAQKLDANLLNLRAYVLKTIRTVMHEAPERRSDIRWPCDFGVKLYPVLPAWGEDQVVDGRAIDLSSHGIGVIVSRRPATNHVYLHPAGAHIEHALLIKIVRCHALKNGEYLLGADFGT